MSICPMRLTSSRTLLTCADVQADDMAPNVQTADEVAVELKVGDARGRVGGIADHDRDRLRDRVQHRALERHEERRIGLGRNRADGTAGHQKTEDVDRIGRIGNDDDDPSPGAVIACAIL